MPSTAAAVGAVSAAGAAMPTDAERAAGGGGRFQSVAPASEGNIAGEWGKELRRQWEVPSRARRRLEERDTSARGGQSGGAVDPGWNVWLEEGTVLVCRSGAPGGVHEGEGRAWARDERRRHTIITHTPVPYATAVVRNGSGEGQRVAIWGLPKTHLWWRVVQQAAGVGAGVTGELIRERGRVGGRDC